MQIDEDFEFRVVAITSKESQSQLDANSILGLLLFEQEVPDPEKMPEDKINRNKVSIRHITSIDRKNLEEMFDLSLDYIWKTVKTPAIRVNLYHYREEDGKLKADKEMKNLLTERKFKWKTVQNDMNDGSRQEILEL